MLKLKLFVQKSMKYLMTKLHLMIMMILQQGSLCKFNTLKEKLICFYFRSTLSRDMIEHDGERYFCAKREEFTDFFRVDPNNPESERRVELLSHGPHITTEEREMVTRRKNDYQNWDEVSDDKIRVRKQQIRYLVVFRCLFLLWMISWILRHFAICRFAIC